MDTGNTLDLPPRFGEGLNSFRIRFTLMAGFFGALVAGMTLWWFSGHDHQIDSGSDWIGFIALVAAILASSVTTYLMTGKLTRPIENLKASTEAIALGDYDTKIMVECQCEVGGLADSFRMMVARLNANVSKINSLAYEDGVTGLPNRAVLFELLEKSAANQGFLLFIDSRPIQAGQ